MSGTTGADALAGSSGNDVMVGLDGADIFVGGAGADQIEGGAGRDTVTYAGAPVGVVARLDGIAGSDGDVLTEIENLTGSNLADRLFGDGAANVLRGGSGADRLRGGAGNDRLFGGTGADALNGEGGADVFVFNAGDSGTGAAADRILGFETGLDRIDLTRLGDLTLASGAVFSGLAGEVRLRPQGATVWVEVDRDGNGTADFALRVSGTVAVEDLLIL